jgi:hypothetical protein
VYKLSKEELDSRRQQLRSKHEEEAKAALQAKLREMELLQNPARLPLPLHVLPRSASKSATSPHSDGSLSGLTTARSVSPSVTLVPSSARSRHPSSKYDDDYDDDAPFAQNSTLNSTRSELETTYPMAQTMQMLDRDVAALDARMQGKQQPADRKDNVAQDRDAAMHYSNVTEKLIGTISRLTQYVSQCQDELERQRTVNKNLEAKVNEVAAQCDVLQQHVQDLQTENDVLRSQVQDEPKGLLSRTAVIEEEMRQWRLTRNADAMSDLMRSFFSSPQRLHERENASPLRSRSQNAPSVIQTLEKR